MPVNNELQLPNPMPGITSVSRLPIDSAFADAEISASPEWIVENTITVDITDDFCLMERARWLTAEAYAPLANPKFGLTLEDVYAGVSQDFYEQHGHVRTVATLTTSPETGARHITGLLSTVIAKGRVREEGIDAIEAMQFIAPLNTWPHVGLGIPDSEIGELARFVIVDACRTPAMREAGVHIELTRRLYEGCMNTVRSRHMQMLYGIMPQHRAKLLAQAGIEIRHIPSRLRRENSSVSAIFENFSLYWNDSNPGLIVFEDASRHISNPVPIVLPDAPVLSS